MPEASRTAALAPRRNRPPIDAMLVRQVWPSTVTTTLGRRPAPSASTTASGTTKPVVVPPVANSSVVNSIAAVCRPPRVPRSAWAVGGRHPCWWWDSRSSPRRRRVSLGRLDDDDALARQGELVGLPRPTADRRAELGRLPD